MEVSLRQLTRQELSIIEAGGRIPAAHVFPGALPPPFVLSRAVAKMAEGEPALWWIPFLIVREADRAVIGGCAFKGPPRSETVEVLYGVSKDCRGRGFASAAVQELARIAFANGAVELLAEIEPGNLASSRVVERCGFERRCERIAEDGLTVVQWVMAR